MGAKLCDFFSEDSSAVNIIPGILQVRFAVIVDGPFVRSLVSAFVHVGVCVHTCPYVDGSSGPVCHAEQNKRV